MATQARPEQNFEVGSRIVPPAGALGWLPKKFWPYIKNYFAYGVNFLPLSASATDQRTVAVDSGSYFVILYATCVETETDNATLLPFMPLLVTLTETSSGSQFSSIPYHANVVFGDAQNPGIFAVPYILKPSAQLQVQLQNLEAEDRNIRIMFHGFKMVPGSNQNTGAMYRQS